MSRKPVNLKTVESTMGLRIQQAMKMRKVDITGLSKATGIPQLDVLKFATDKRFPNSTQILAMAKALGVKSEYFFRRETIVAEGSEG